MLLIGLTGSIATGKSTVSSILSSPPYSLPVIDADILARQVVEPGTAGYRAIVSYFSPTTPDLLLPPSESMPEAGPTGRGRPLNRPALGRRVFGTDEQRKKDRAVLNGIVHPAVRKEIWKGVVRAYVGGHWGVVLDVPLLFEAGLDRICGSVVVVAVRDEKVQMERLRRRDPHLSEQEAEDRVRSQGDVREKARRAEARGRGRGEVVWNDEGRGELEREVGRVVESLRAGRPAWWNWLLLGCPPLAVVVGVWEYWNNGKINAQWEEVVRREKAKL